ncbi:transposase [Streptomyces sp. NK08204]|uniref:IS110 family transposase n=1 Tax=Streptomyces sp. NK08204 TaxID=2873260 RepID=UPI001CEDD011|nr:transposase [Streptomyces sp. NK08204]
MAAVAAEDTAGQNVIGGVGSHAGTPHVAVISDNGGHLADAESATTAAGYAAALAFLTAHGHVIPIGVEGTPSYGAGFTRTARSQGLHIVEVNRPDRAERRRIGKSDPIDACAAARAALSGRASGAPKGDTVAGIRALHNAARSAVKARTAAPNQIGQILRLLKRAIAREMFRCLTIPVTVPGIADLRPLRQAKNITLTAAARHFGVWPATISTLERGIRRETPSPTPTATGSRPLDEQ